MNTNQPTMQEETASIRRRIKAECKTLSVTQGKGTARSWVDIRGSGAHGNFTADELAALARLGMHNPGGNFSDLNGSERQAWARKLQVSPNANYTRIDDDFYD